MKVKNIVIGELNYPTSTKSYLKLEHFDGQSEIVKALKVLMRSTLRRCETLEHLLLCGDGKTNWLGKCVAYELGSKLWTVYAAELNKESLSELLTSLEEGDVVLIKDFDKLKQGIIEGLYLATKDFSLKITIGQGKQQRTITIDLPHFTVIGTTSNLDSVSATFRDSFTVFKFR